MGKQEINWTELIMELKGGKMILLEKVYSLYKSDFIKYAHRFRLDDDQILEVYQDSILVLYENVIFDKIRNRTASIKTYLFSIGKNQMLSEIKKNRKVVTSIKEVEDTALITDQEDLSDPEKYQTLNQAFEKIGENCKKLLIKSYYQGISNAALLEIYNYKNDQTLRSHKSRCLKKLRTELIKLKKM